ncbi:MAG: tRNA (adenosine(37)-N6)-threonylcarbamoyltransferase complex dimerization subunit type 1 TsaB [Nesterenkonia sp.]|nr:tRNA (adenosine(37)-N6)-threonylcarbamoyltransferase complex dimerization subunit type 1 TsaB [Nesterenkonia sp.]
MLLAIDSSAGASAAVLDAGTAVGSWRTEATTTHAEVLATGVQEVLAQAELEPTAPQRPAGRTGQGLEAVVVGVGPGPFTGLRVGLVLAHALAEVWSLPLHGVSGLDGLALRAVEQGLVDTGGDFQVAVDARRREVYSARYRAGDDSEDPGSSGVVRLGAPQVGPAHELPDLAVIGVGAELYPDSLTPVPGTETWTADAVELGRLAAHPVHRLDPRPLYLRDSDAKVPAPRKRAQP